MDTLGMPPDLGPFAATAQRGFMAAFAVAFVALGYLAITLDRRRETSPSRDDTHVGIKLVIWGLLLAAALMAADAAEDLLAFVLGGFKGGWAVMRGPIASLASAAVVGGGVYMMFLPRTNNAERPQVERLGVGAVAAILGASALVSLDAFLNALLGGKPWAEIAAGLAGVGVSGGVALLAVTRLGALSGWRAAPRGPQMPMQPPMSGTPMGMPPGASGGMPPLGGGYPPAGGGGYPPAGGGYPPTGGGWPGQ
jgi:hypothetical protein